MGEGAAIGKSAFAWPAPPAWLGALSGVVVVLGFTIDAGPMLFAGALCGSCIVWSYRTGVADHSTAAWFRYAGLYAVEMIALGAVSLAVLRPDFTMAELLVADDASERLMLPSVPLLTDASFARQPNRCQPDRWSGQIPGDHPTVTAQPPATVDPPIRPPYHHPVGSRAVKTA